MKDFTAHFNQTQARTRNSSNGNAMEKIQSAVLGVHYGEMKAMPILLALFVVSYFFFVTYDPGLPTNLNKNRAVEVGQISNVELPTLVNSQVLSYARSSTGEQTTLQSEQNPQDIKNFYQKYLLDNGWEVENDANTETGSSTKYKKDNSRIDIAISQQKNAQSEFLEAIVDISYASN